MIYALLTAAGIVLLGTLSLSARQPPAPTIAEFSPDTTRQVSGGPSARDRLNRDQPPIQQGLGPGEAGQNLGEGQQFGGDDGLAASSGGDSGVGGGGDGPAGQGTGSPPAPVTDPTQPVDPLSPGENEQTNPQPSPPPDPFNSPQPSSHVCAGNPPRQIDDPQSPACVTVSEAPGINGRGVSSTKINIANPWARPTNATVTRIFNALETFFNKNFQFHGREIDLVPVQWNVNGDWGSTPDDLRQRADEVANRVGESEIFASVGSWFGTSGIYEDQLASHGIVSAFAVEPAVTEGHYAANHPYQWSYMPDIATIGRNLGEWVCAQLPPGQTASHAGSPQNLNDRKFGYVLSGYSDLIAPGNADGRPDVGALDSALASRCNVPAPPRVTIPYRASTDPAGSTASAETQMLNLVREGVTSVICVCKIADARTFIMAAATNVGFYPEWIFSSFGQNDFDAYLVPTGNAEQMRHAMGITFRNKWIPDMPVQWAVRQVDPTLVWPEQTGGADLSFQAAQYWQAWRYPPLLLLASGIQAAGGNLDAATFGSRLQGTAFPGEPNFPVPGYAGKASFSNDHTMVDEAAVMWWAPAQRSTWGGQTGAWCVGNERHSLGTWRAEPIFTGPSCP